MTRFVFLDIETTGLNYEDDEIIEISAVRINENFEKLEEFDELIKPKIPIQPFITNLTGISNEMVTNAFDIEEIKTKFLDFIKKEDIICGHNIIFDISFLNANEFDLENKFIDTFKLSSILFEKELSYSLETLAKKFNIIHEDAHRAMSDVKANIDLFEEIVKKFHSLSKENQDLYQKLSERSLDEKSLLFNNFNIFKKTNQNNNSKEEVVINQQNKKIEQYEISTDLQKEIQNHSNDNVLIKIPPKTKIVDFVKNIKSKDRKSVLITNFYNTPEETIFLELDKILCFDLINKKINSNEKLSESEILCLLKIISREKKETVYSLGLNKKERDTAVASFCHQEPCSETCDSYTKYQKIKNLDFFVSNLEAIKNLKNRDIFIDNAENILNNLDNKLKKTLYMSEIENFLELDGVQNLIKILQEYFRNFAGKSKYKKDFIFEKNETEDMQEILNKIKDIDDNNDIKLKSIIEFLVYFLSNNDENEIKIISIFSNDFLVFTIIKKSIIDEFDSIANGNRIFFISDNLQIKNGRYTLESEDITPNKQFEVQSNINYLNSYFFTPNQNGNDKTDNEFKSSRFLKNILLENKKIVKNLEFQLYEKFLNKNMLFLLNTPALAENAFLDVAKIENEIDHQVIFANFSKGKVFSKVQEKKSIIIAAANMMKNIDFENINFSFIVQHRLIFNNSNVGFDKFRNNFSNDFQDVALPNSIKTFKKLLNNISKKDNDFIWFCLDSCFENQNSFGKYFLDSLPKDINLKNLTLS